MQIKKSKTPILKNKQTENLQRNDKQDNKEYIISCGHLSYR